MKLWIEHDNSKIRVKIVWWRRVSYRVKREGAKSDISVLGHEESQVRITWEVEIFEEDIRGTFWKLQCYGSFDNVHVWFFWKRNHIVLQNHLLVPHFCHLKGLWCLCWLRVLNREWRIREQNDRMKDNWFMVL